MEQSFWSTYYFFSVINYCLITLFLVFLVFSLINLYVFSVEELDTIFCMNLSAVYFLALNTKNDKLIQLNIACCIIDIIIVYYYLFHNYSCCLQSILHCFLFDHLLYVESVSLKLCNNTIE